MVQDTLTQLATDIDTTCQSLRGHLGKLRTGRANVSLLDGIRVSMYGAPTPLSQCASLQVQDARMLTIKPWDRKLLGEIEKAISTSSLGIMPQNDGEMLRLPIPPLTEERRRDLVKQGKQRGEEAKIGLRTHRRDANDSLKEQERDKGISQDELKRALDKVQTQIDGGIKRVEEILAVKEKEIMSI